MTAIVHHHSPLTAGVTAPTGGPSNPQPQAYHAEGAEAPAQRLSSHSLLGSQRQVEIVHGDAVYRLRLTALGKLILTK